MIYLGCDHGGYQLKEQMKDWLTGQGKAFEDLGALTFDPDDDYPQFAFAVAQKVAQDPTNAGILFCRSASGMVIAANKVKHIRAAAAYDVKQAKHSRQHDNANILGISGDWTDAKTAQDMVKAFLNTPFSNEERHIRRIEQIERLASSV